MAWERRSAPHGRLPPAYLRPCQRASPAHLALRGDGAAKRDAAPVEAHTGRYLQPGGASWGAAAALFQRQPASWASNNVACTVEDHVVTRRGLVELWLELLVSGAGSAWADAVSVIPAVNFTSVHGHNLDALVTSELRSSSGAFASVDTLERTLQARPMAFYQRLDETFRRYWRLKLASAPPQRPDLARGMGTRPGAHAALALHLAGRAARG